MGATYREGEGIEGVVARGALALDGLEKSNATEDLGERGPKENLGHATGLDEEIVGGDGVDLLSKTKTKIRRGSFTSVISPGADRHRLLNPSSGLFLGHLHVHSVSSSHLTARERR
jgi:hypothetical protein